MNMCALPISIIFGLSQVSDRAHLVFDFHQAVDGLQVVTYILLFINFLSSTVIIGLHFGFLRFLSS
jgi:hypothetical protein